MEMERESVYEVPEVTLLLAEVEVGFAGSEPDAGIRPEDPEWS